MHDGVVAAIASNSDNFGLAGNAILGVLDAVGFSWVIRSELAGSDDDLEIGGLIQAFGFAGIDAGNNGFQGDIGVCTSDRPGGGVVGAGCGGFDVRDGLAPVG